MLWYRKIMDIRSNDIEQTYRVPWSNLQSSGISNKFNPRTYTQSRTPTVVQREGGGRVNGSLPCVFYMLQYFETILPSVESLWSSLQDEVYFIGGGGAGGLWRADIWLICTVAREMHYFSKCNVKLRSVSILSLKQYTLKQLFLLVFVISGIIKVSVSVISLGPRLDW